MTSRTKKKSQYAWKAAVFSAIDSCRKTKKSQQQRMKMSFGKILFVVLFYYRDGSFLFGHL